MAERLYAVGVIAKLLNVTERRIQQLAKEGIIPKAQRGKYDLIPCVQGYVKYLQDLAFGKDIVPIDINLAKSKQMAAQAELTEIELAERRATLIDARKVAAWWTKIVTNAKQNLLALPSRAAPLVMACKTMEQARAEIENLVNEALDTLSEYNPDSDPGGSDRVETPRKADRKRMGGRKQKTKPGKRSGARKLANRKGPISKSDHGRGK